MKDDRVDELIKALGDKYYYVRESAVAALVKIGVLAVYPLIQALWDGDSSVRRSAAKALGKIGDVRAVEPLTKSLGDQDLCIRKEAAEALGKIGDARVVEPLIQLLVNDQHSDVRESVAEALDKLHWSPASDTERTYYFIARHDWVSVVSLGVLAIEPLIKMQEFHYIKTDGTDSLNKICSQITEIIFGGISSNNTKTCVKNLETSQLTIPMSSLAKIHIDAETHDFDMVERFITYAINYVGQKHLRKKVEVYIYGNPDKLHQNIMNSFKNLCRKVIIQEKG